LDKRKMSTNKFTINETQKLILNSTLNSEKLVHQAFTNIKWYADFNAFITTDYDRALDQAKHQDISRAKGEVVGPLDGITVAVKDNIHVAGLPNTAGTLALKDFIPDKDATVVTKLKNAGAIVIGKTNMHELAYGVTSANKTFGAVANAISKTCFAGGSSGGTATAVALNMATIGLGTDTGGSVRIPAALNGLVGFRPTVNRYSSNGLTLISHTRDTVGLITNSVKDAQVVDEVLSNEIEKLGQVSLAKLRIGVPSKYFYENLEPTIAKRAELFLEQLKQVGVELVYADLENISELNELVGFPVVLHETKELLKAYLKHNYPQETVDSLLEKISDPEVKGILEMSLNGSITEEIYQNAINVERPALQKLYTTYFDSNHVEAIIFPTTPLSARPINGSSETVELNGKRVPTFQSYIHNTDPGSNAGIPGLSIPLGNSDDGLPFGIEIDGPTGSDRRLLSIGAELESLIRSVFC
jgi:Asp-tRNA(Asn)/Glu-tRNA(Gln) amidotransferase A subunit family amidase